MSQCKCGSNGAKGYDCVCGKFTHTPGQGHIVPAAETYTPAGALVGNFASNQNPPVTWLPLDVGPHNPGSIAEFVRKFETGATRSADTGRYDPEGFMHPVVIERFCEYMHKNRLQPDGTIRDSDNWQKGIPFATYVKGLWRHFLHLWTRHRGSEPYDDKASDSAVDDCCAILFNAHGYIYEALKATGRIK